MFKAPIKVKDDNTQKAKHDRQEESVRLLGIDTPESKANKKAKKDAERSNSDEEIIKAVYASVLTYALNVKYEDRFLKAYP